jgi:hypothetical protein
MNDTTRGILIWDWMDPCRAVIIVIISSVIHSMDGEIKGFKKILYKPVGDRDEEVLGMGSFGEYTQLYGN